MPILLPDDGARRIVPPPPPTGLPLVDAVPAAPLMAEEAAFDPDGVLSPPWMPPLVADPRADTPDGLRLAMPMAGVELAALPDPA